MGSGVDVREEERAARVEERAVRILRVEPVAVREDLAERFQCRRRVLAATNRVLGP